MESNSMLQNSKEYIVLNTAIKVILLNSAKPNVTVPG